MIPNRRRHAALRPFALFPACVLAFSTSALAADEPLAIPPIPTIVIPDIIGVEPVQKQFEAALGKQLEKIDGVRVAPARCDAEGAFVPAAGMTLRDDAGLTANLGDRGQYVIGKDGAGTANVGGTQIVVEKDGSGTINRAGAKGRDAVQISIEADGSGTYNGPLGQIALDGRGGGTWSSPRLGQIAIESDGSGTWNGPLGQVVNDGNGGGSWNGPERVINHGDGTGRVGTPGREVAMDPLPPVPPAGRFPLLTKFRVPPAACGYVVTLEDRILFDFDKHDLRADAAGVVAALSKAFVQVKPKRLEIRGHTDGKGSAEYNQTLSERRAATVEKALAEHGVASAMQSRGFGKSQPVAANEVGGKDNPSGRQLNRRVEIYVPNG